MLRSTNSSANERAKQSQPKDTYLSFRTLSGGGGSLTLFICTLTISSMRPLTVNAVTVCTWLAVLPTIRGFAPLQSATRSISPSASSISTFAVLSGRSDSSTSSSALYAFNLPNPFARDTGSVDDTDLNAEFADTATGLIRQARRLLSADFGILDPTLLAPEEEFCWIGPFLDEPLSRTEYLAAGRFFDLRAAFPDLDYRAHDFRIVDDTNEPRTVRFTCRTTGTMRGPLRLRSGTLPPTGQTLRGPPEAVTVTFNRRGQVTKLCTGFCMDRQVGNTRGATGVMTAAMVAGQPPSDWDLYPAPAVIASKVAAVIVLIVNPQ